MNNYTVLDLREQLFKWQHVRQQFNDFKTFKRHLYTFLGFKVKVSLTVDNTLLKSCGSFMVRTVGGYHLEVRFVLDIFDDCIRFKTFEIESQREFNIEKQKEMFLLKVESL